MFWFRIWFLWNFFIKVSSPLYLGRSFLPWEDWQKKCRIYNCGLFHFTPVILYVIKYQISNQSSPRPLGYPKYDKFPNQWRGHTMWTTMGGGFWNTVSVRKGEGLIEASQRKQNFSQTYTYVYILHSMYVCFIHIHMYLHTDDPAQFWLVGLFQVRFHARCGTSWQVFHCKECCDAENLTPFPAWPALWPVTRGFTHSSYM